MYSKVLTVAAVCVVCVLAAPPTDVVPLEKQQPTVIPIVSQSEELEANGTFKFSYETGNGIKREEEAYVKIVPKAKSRSASSDEGGESDEDSNEIHVQRGSYSYTAPDGTVITVSYIADENGFQPVGDHIPRVPSAVPATSSEKSGKLVKPADSTVSASEPKKQAKLAPAPASAPAPAPASAPAPAPASAPAPVPASAQASASSAPAASAPSPAANLSASDEKPEELPKEATTEKSNENTEKLASEESSSESTSNPTSMQPNSAEATEASASTSTEASDEKQTTTNPITESSPTSDDQNPSTTSSTPSSGEELSSTTTAS